MSRSPDSEREDDKSKRDTPVRQIIADVCAGRLSIADVAVDDRRACVKQLDEDGGTRREISRILGISEATVSRDRDANRKANALHARPGLAAELAGDFARHSESMQEQMRRLSRDEKATPAVRLGALKACFRAALDTMKMLQSMGYLPHVKPTPGTPAPAPGSTGSPDNSGDTSGGTSGDASGGSGGGGFGCDDNTGVPMDDEMRQACGPQPFCWKYPRTWVRRELDESGRPCLAIRKQVPRPCNRPCQPPLGMGIVNPLYRDERDPNYIPPELAEPLIPGGPRPVPDAPQPPVSRPRSKPTDFAAGVRRYREAISPSPMCGCPFELTAPAVWRQCPRPFHQ